MIDVVYCAGGNPRFAEIAQRAGWLYGLRSDYRAYGPVWLLDQNWTKPAFDQHRAACEKLRPHMASITDLERPDQLNQVLTEAEEIAPHTDRLMIIPKVVGIVPRIPRIIGGKPVTLGYSVPTTHGGTPCHPSEFIGWPVHLLGGAPDVQMTFALYFLGFVGQWRRGMSAARRLAAWQQSSMQLVAPLVPQLSLDCNYHQRKATNWCARWEWPGVWIEDGGVTVNDAHLRAFEASCVNIMAAWQTIRGYTAVPGRYAQWSAGL